MAETDAHPITVAIKRRIDPARAVEATSWMQAGTDLATTFDGFLGSGWVRAGEGSDLWYMLYRFRDIPTLEAWDDSPQRGWWLESGRAFASEVRVERRTGIEGWFDAPVTTEITAPAPRPAPPRWKQAVTIWLVFFPLNLLATVTLGTLLADVHVALRVAVVTLTLTPIMTYLLLPWVTKRLEWWLHGRPWRERR